MALFYIAGYIVRNDEQLEDGRAYFHRDGYYLREMNRGGLTIPDDNACQWTCFSYIVFHFVCTKVCRMSLARILLTISNSYDLNMEMRHSVTLSNILINNYCKAKTPRSTKETKQKVLKLSDQPSVYYVYKFLCDKGSNKILFRIFDILM